MKGVKKYWYDKLQRNALSYVRTNCRNITTNIEPLLMDYNHYCYYNAGEYITATEDRHPVKNPHYSSRMVLVYCYDHIDKHGFLHCVVSQKTPYTTAKDTFIEVTLGYLTPRYDYYLVEHLQGNLVDAETLFNNARLAFLQTLNVPKWYKWFFHPSDLL